MTTFLQQQRKPGLGFLAIIFVLEFLFTASAVAGEDPIKEFLFLMTRARTYRGEPLSTRPFSCESVASCQEAIALAEALKRYFSENSKNFRTTITGQKLFLDSSYPELGRLAFRDPNGVIWGEAVKFEKKVRFFTYPDAVKYCESQGGRLPQHEDYRNLSLVLGYGSADGYYPYYKNQKQKKEVILPDLATNYYWTDQFVYHPSTQYVFNGKTAEFTTEEIRDDRIYYVGLRCIRRVPLCPSISKCEDVIATAKRKIRELTDLINEVESPRTKIKFTAERSIPTLGNAWRDPSGLVWGEVVHGGERYLNSYANNYCKSGGNRLPTREDILRLRNYQGYGMPLGYWPYNYDGKTPLLGSLEDIFIEIESDLKVSKFSQLSGEIYDYQFDNPFQNEIRSAFRCVRD